MSTQSRPNELTAIVPIRAGSKGLPNKNIMLVNGLPLYMHAVSQAIRTVGSVVLSTDIESIDEIGLPPFCTLCRRPRELATDDTPMEDVIRHLIEEQSLVGTTLVLLQATSPLRSDNDVNAGLSLFKKGHHDLVMSVVERDRSALKYGILEGTSFGALREPSFCFANRQSLPRIHGPNGAIYIFEAETFIRSNGFPTQKIGAIEMPIERSTDIDDLVDLQLIEKMGLISSNL